MRVILCDDKLEEIMSVQDLIDGYRGIKKTDISCLLPEELMKGIESEDFECDIAILDIEFPELEFNGIDLGRKLNEKYPSCQIIYLTHILEYASDVYETEHVYFVMKKNKELTLFRALDKAIDVYLENRNKNHIDIVSNGRKVMVLQHSICYFERQQRLVNIHTLDNVITTYESLTKCVGRLSNEFSRCHGGYVVNMSYILNVETDKITMKDGDIIPIGRSYKDHFMRKYMDYLSLRM